MDGQEKKLLIIGCGYVGKALGSHFFKKGWSVTGWARAQESVSGLASLGIEPHIGDVADERDWRGISPDFDQVVYCAATGGGGAASYGRVYLKGLSLADAFFPKNVPLLYTSSTSVYAQDGGEWVTEDSPSEPASETGRILVETEKVVLARNGTVARLGAIYGPGRSALLNQFFAGSPPSGNPDGWVNQIYRDDIIGAIEFLMERAQTGIVNVCDSEPVRRIELCKWFSERLKMPMPMAGGVPAPGGRDRGNKRVANTRLVGLGWNPRFPSFREGYEAVLKCGF